MGKQVLLVVYDAGSAGPERIAEAAAEHDCTLLFALADTPHAQDMAATLEAFGAVVDLDDVDELREYEPDGIVTFSEYQLGRTAELAAALGLTHHDLAAVPAITRKDLQREALRAAGVDGIRARTVRSADEIDAALAEVGLPAIVKPVVSASSRNTVALTTHDEARGVVTELLALESELLLEERLVGRPTPHPWGDYVAVDCVVDGDEVVPVFVTSKFTLATPFRERGGYGARSVLPADEIRTLTELSGRAVRAVGIRGGMAQVEIKLTAEGPRVIEVNGRLGGWTDDLALRSATCDPVATAVAAALGRPLPRPDVLGTGPVVFYYLIVPPMHVGRVTAIGDITVLRTLPGVERVQVLTEAGADVSWRTGSQSAVAALSGQVDTHEQLAELTDLIESAHWIEYA
ncbi:acetyl-CoA carboxylase biotin carboxylase subunit family protein [Streptomyces sp. NPDC050504]|uniref:acetyl-CoA carboxylase biotin carboxylase subunit family protein n=1 Tax=Streptomyces sp. NPDC050504 TaxID=3365618 RepID=UPI0037A922AD